MRKAVYLYCQTTGTSMPRIQRRYQWLTALFTFVSLLPFWKPVLFDPHLYLFGPGGDGVKNYFTPLFYILNDHAAHFTGMNYPYGEHLAYIDAQPWISLVMSQFLNGNAAYSGNIIAILNLLMLLSIPLAAVYLFRIFSLWNMPGYYSAVVAACIALLSPQVFRMTGHYALAYACFVPMIWYYAASWLQEGRLSSVIYLLLTLCFFGGLHAYYLALGASFILPLAFLSLISKKFSGKALPSALTLVVVSVLPLVAYSIWLQVSGANDLPDRHPRPYGFFHYTASLWSIFLPHQGPVYKLLLQFLPMKAREFEGMAYVGSATLIALAGGLWAWRFRKSEGVVAPPFLLLYLLAAILGLLVSMSFPFNAIPSAWVPEPIWQFRALGRFSWTFYYVFAAVAAWMLYIWAESFRKRGQSVVAMGLVISCLLLWASEGFSAHKSISNYVKEHGRVAEDFLGHENSIAKLLSDANRKPEAFQAILSFPYFSIGSEEIYIERSSTSLYHACKAALELKLPIAQTFLGRTSVSQTMQLVQMLSHDAIPKEVLNHLTDERPFLLITNGDEIWDDEQRLLTKASLLIESEGLRLYELPISAFGDNREEYIKQYQKRVSSGRFLTKEIAGDTVLFNKGATFIWKQALLQDEGKGAETILLDTTSLQPNLFEASVWLRSELKRAAFPVMYVKQYDVKGALLREDFCNPKSVTDVYIQEVLAKVLFVLEANTHRLLITLEGKEEKSGHSFLLKSPEPIYIRRKEGLLLMNNYPIEHAPGAN
jgi:hypothetical protein